MDITRNGIYRSDSLALLERLPSEVITLAYIDPPWVSGVPFGIQGTKEKLVKENLIFLSRILQQVQRVLTNTGTIYFHSVPGFSLDVPFMLNQIFGQQNARRVIIYPGKSYGSRMLIHRMQPDNIFVYSKTDEYTDIPIFRPLSDREIREKYKYSDEYGAYTLISLLIPSSSGKNRFEWSGYSPKEREAWRYPKEKLDQLEVAGGIVYSSSGGAPRMKQYLEESPGIPIGSVWMDISSFIPSNERTGYSDQEPLALLDRIIKMSSSPGDIVLDPFCGSGTSLVAAQANGCRWIGCDVDQQAYEITVKRLYDSFGLQPHADFVTDEQSDLEKYPAIDKTYKPVLTSLGELTPNLKHRFVLNKPVEMEETRCYEFKEIKGVRPAESIKNTADEYVVAFLNSEGGSIFWGVRDSDRTTVGVRLTLTERDEIRRVVSNKLGTIQPHIDPTEYRIEFHPVVDEDRNFRTVMDLYVVEIVVPRVYTNKLYFTGGNKAYVKIDGVKRPLVGPEIQDWIERRFQR